MSKKSPNLSKASAPPLQPLAQESKLTLYVGFFTIGYVLASAIFMIVQTQVAVNPQLVTLLSIFLAAYIAVQKFIKHHGRALQRAEMNRLTFAGTAIVWLLTAFYFVGIWLWLFDEANRQVFTEMTVQQPLPLLTALLLIMIVTFISARISIALFNRLLAPK